MESLPTDLVYYWIAAAIIAAILELILPSFIFIFAAVGALVGALTSCCLSFPLQLLVAGLVFLISALSFRSKLLVRFQKNQPEIHSRSGIHLGKLGLVTETLHSVTHQGRVTVEGEDWSAKADQVIEAGKTIEVIGHDGIVLIVKEKI